MTRASSRIQLILASKKEAGDGKQLQKEMQMVVPVLGVGLIICCVASCYVDIVARG